MRLQGAEVLSGSPEALWEVLFDPDVVAASIPGCRSLRQVDEDRYVGIVELRFGLFARVFDATFRVVDRVYPNRYRLLVEARGKGGGVDAVMAIALEPNGAAGTVMRYDTEAHVRGGLSAVGAFMGEPIARMLLTQGLADLRRKIEEKLR
jgi:carbon monoxide dehydrogenase subunit G